MEKLSTTRGYFSLAHDLLPIKERLPFPLHRSRVNTVGRIVGIPPLGLVVLLGVALSSCGGSDGGGAPPVATLECASSYQVTRLKPSLFPPEPDYAWGINNNNQVVGNSDSHAVLWIGGDRFPLGGWGLSDSASDINDSGQITGSSDISIGSTTQHAVLWNWPASTPTDLGSLGGTNSHGSGINASGQVVGGSQIIGDLAYHAFLWNSGSMTDLGTLGGTASYAHSINSTGEVVGSSQLAGDAATHAFLWKAGTMRDLGTLGGTHSVAFDINDVGQIAGTSRNSVDTNNHAFLLSGGTMTDLGPPNGTATSVNNKGHVVGNFSFPSATTGSHAFRYCGGIWSDLNSLSASDPGWELSEAHGINETGQIIGWGIWPYPYIAGVSNIYAFLLNPQ